VLRRRPIWFWRDSTQAPLAEFIGLSSTRSCAGTRTALPREDAVQAHAAAAIRNERLEEFFGGYFHQDWDVEGATSWRDVIKRYAVKVPQPQVLAIRADLQDWLNETATDKNENLPPSFPRSGAITTHGRRRPERTIRARCSEHVVLGAYEPLTPVKR